MCVGMFMFKILCALIRNYMHMVVLLVSVSMQISVLA